MALIILVGIHLVHLNSAAIYPVESSFLAMIHPGDFKFWMGYILVALILAGFHPGDIYSGRDLSTQVIYKIQ